MIPAPGAELCRTERLILRRFTEEDIPAYFELTNQPRVEATLVPGPETLEASGREIAMLEGHWAVRGMSMVAVIEKTTKFLVGRVGPWFPYGWPEPEVGWTIHPRRHRSGYAVEAARAACRWLLINQPDLDRVIHLIADTNTASQAVARKLGAEKTDQTHRSEGWPPMPIWATRRSLLL